MRLSPTDFNRHLRHMGNDFVWRKAYACPCVNPNSGAAKPNCPLCSGKGRTWANGVSGKAGIVGRETMKDFAAFGVWDSGDVMLSIPSDSPLYAIGQYDRVSASNRSEPFSMNRTRGTNDVYRFSVLAIDRVFWLDAQNVTHESTPPTIALDGTVTWGEQAEGNVAPPVGSTYSITGRRTPEFFVYQDMPFDRPLHYGASLPRRVQLRRFDLYGK